MGKRKQFHDCSNPMKMLQHGRWNGIGVLYHWTPKKQTLRRPGEACDYGAKESAALSATNTQGGKVEKVATDHISTL